MHAGIPPPGSRYPPPGGADPPWSRPPPGADTQEEQTPLGSRHPPGADSPGAQHAGRYGQRVGGTHPTGKQSCDNYVANQLIFSSVTSLCVHVPAWVFFWLYQK